MESTVGYIMFLNTSGNASYTAAWTSILSHTFTTLVNRRILVQGEMAFSPGGAGQVNVGIGPSVGSPDYQRYYYANGGGWLSQLGLSYSYTTTATSNTRILQIAQATGSGGGTAMAGATLNIQDIGPVGNPPAA